MRRFLDGPSCWRPATGGRHTIGIDGLHHDRDASSRTAVLFTQTYGRVLAPGLTELDPRLPAKFSRRSPLARAWRYLDRSLDESINDALAAA